MEPKDFVSGQDVQVDILQKRILSAKSEEDKARFQKELDELMQVTFSSKHCNSLEQYIVMFGFFL